MAGRNVISKANTIQPDKSYVELSIGYDCRLHVFVVRYDRHMYASDKFDESRYAG